MFFKIKQQPYSPEKSYLTKNNMTNSHSFYKQKQMYMWFMVEVINIKPRLYQEMILNTCNNKNTLVVLPTGMGKSILFLLLAISRLNFYPKAKVIISSPTKPLCQQHVELFQKNTDLKEDEIILSTGHTPPEKRKEQYRNAKVIVATPQTIANDILNRNIDIENTCLFCADEAHLAVGEYDYCFIAEQFNKKSRFPRILALTASPGSELETIEEVCKNLFIEEIEIRSEEDEDVKDYVQEVETDYVYVDLSDELKEVKAYLDKCVDLRIEKLKKYEISKDIVYFGKKQFLEFQKMLQGRIARGEKSFEIWNCISLVSQLIKIDHARELLETQSINSLHKYLENMFITAEKGKVRATKILVNDSNFKSAYLKVIELKEKGIEHPKLEELKRIVENEIKKSKDGKIIVFTQFRDSAVKIEKTIQSIPNVAASIFVGQTKKDDIGMSQKKQIGVLKDFKLGFFNILICTSVGELGLDIPSVEVVIFYEPVPSAIRKIQRSGRTGRLEAGKVIMLITKNTRDEAYKWTAHHKERRMYKILKDLKNKIKLKNHPTLEKFIEKENSLVADYREKSSHVIKELTNLGVDVSLEQLPAADFKINDIGIEKKTKSDFINSMMNKRLIYQLRNLRRQFKRPLLIIEGEEDLYSIRKVHANAIRGMLAAIAIDYKVPMIYSKNPKDTAEIINRILVREKNPEKETTPIMPNKPLSTREQQEFILESFPGVGTKLAKSLLKKFKTIQNITNSTEEELSKIDKIGNSRAKEILRIVKEIYEEEDAFPNTS